MRDKYLKKLLAEMRSIEAENPTWRRITSRDFENISRQKQVAWTFAGDFARILMRGQEPPKARLEIRIEVKLPVGMTRHQKRLLEVETDIDSINTEPAEIIIKNITSYLTEYNLKWSIDRNSRKKYYITAWPNETFKNNYFKSDINLDGFTLDELISKRKKSREILNLLDALLK
jgi:hypothetical protein